MSREIKQFLAKIAKVESFNGDSGEIVVKFGNIDVEDSDGDIFLPGSYATDRKVAMADFMHSNNQPIGVGNIVEDKDFAYWDGRMFVQDADANDAAKSMWVTFKEMGEDQEFSYRFFAREYTIVEDRGPWGWGFNFADVDTYEVSGVFRGATVDTGIEEMKSARE